ncbi:hypothetical protein [Marinicella sp. W31]|uniref:hypothetical protein n=1 Tax=Marinicella sp. W31 TaxID=3023713 RepID=UPI00375811C7
MNIQIQKIWDKHIKITYPFEKDLLIKTINLLELYQSVHEIIDGYVKIEGVNLSLENQQLLEKSQGDFKKVIPELTGNGLIYFKRMAELTQLVLNDSDSKFPARLHVLVARHSSNAIVIRRGPSKQVCTFNWDRKTNTFTQGQWLKKARIFERRSDISANGKYWIYFAMDARWDSETKGSYTVISKTPWLKALVLYAKGDGWHGGGLFSYDNVYWLNDGYGHEKKQHSNLVKRNKDYQPKENYGGECPHVYYNRLQRDGWKLTDSYETGKRNSNTVFERDIARGWTLRKICHADSFHPMGKGVYWDEHELINKQGDTISQPDWEWAEWMDNAVMFAEFGKLYKLIVKNTIELRKRQLIHDFNDYKFEELIAPY